MKEALKWILKIGLIVLAFYLVFRKLSWEDVRRTWSDIHAAWLIPAFILYNASQFLSSFRLLKLFRSADVHISYPDNLRLYYKSMFFGLFLPGGVSGDAYKVIYLQKHSDAGYRTLITATLLDRANGLAMLLSIAAILLSQKPELLKGLIPQVPFSPLSLILLVCLAWLAYVIIHRKWFPSFSGVLPQVTALSLVAQVCQLFSFFCILHAFSILPFQFLAYGILFYTGSVLSALPLSISGLGIREWVLVTGSGLMGLESARAFSASLVFTLIAGVCALIGAIIKMKEQPVGRGS
jgi:uncharacterized membrane protein YbhN (UPF0104 family)